MLHCLDVASGRVLWKHDCRREYWGVAKDASGDDAWFPPCGCASSALAFGNEVILSVGGPKAGAFAAFDRDTGRLAWSSLDDRGSYGSPVLATMAGVPQLIGFTGKRMVGLDARSHELLWEQPFRTEFEQTAITPVIWRDLVIFGGERRPLVALRISSDGHRVKPQAAWQNVDLRPYITTPVVVGDQLIGLDVAGETSSRIGCALIETNCSTHSPASRFGRFHRSFTTYTLLSLPYCSGLPGIMHSVAITQVWSGLTHFAAPAWPVTSRPRISAACASRIA
jgi:hypothetical protein